MVRRSASKRKDAGSTPRFGSRTLSSKIVIYGHYLDRGFALHDSWNIKTAHIAAHLNAETILVVTFCPVLMIATLFLMHVPLSERERGHVAALCLIVVFWCMAIINFLNRISVAVIVLKVKT